MAWTTSRMSKFIVVLSMLAIMVASTGVIAAEKDAKRKMLTIDEAFEASQLTGAPILAVAGDAD